MQPLKLSFLILASSLILFSGDLMSQTTVDIPASSDNTIYQEFADNSNGSGDYMFAGNTVSGNSRRALIKFDGINSQIPKCATITGVTLTLRMSRTIAGSVDVSLHKLLQDWGEAGSDAPGEEGFGTQAEPGDATWTKNFYNYSNWDRAGGYYENTSSAVTAVSGNGYYTWSSSQMVSDVQNWLLSPQSAYGWIIIADESATPGAKRFDTRENPNASYRPKLTVTYTSSPTISLTLQALIEGRWDGNTMAQDTALIQLRSATFPYAIADSKSAVIDELNSAQVCLGSAGSGSYYIVVKHRNSIETWSSAPVALTTSSQNSFDFTSSATSAYGNNLTLKAGRYCIYSGDVDQDGTVDGTDLQLIDNDSFQFAGGYLLTDLNGDDFVDGTDASIAGNNSDNFVSVVRP